MKRIFFFSIIFIFLISNSYAFGIAQDYIKDNTLKLYPGQERSVKLTLQNPDDSELRVNLTITGDDIAILYPREDFYLIPPKTYNKIVYLNFTVPKDSKVNDTFTVRYTMQPIIKDKTGSSIVLNTQISQPIHVLVVQEPKIEKDYSKLKKSLLWIIGFIVLIAIFWRMGTLLNKKFFKK